MAIDSTVLLFVAGVLVYTMNMQSQATPVPTGAEVFVFEELSNPGPLQLNIQMPSGQNTTTVAPPQPDTRGALYAGDFRQVRSKVARFHARDRVGGMGSKVYGDRNTGEPLRWVANLSGRTQLNEIF